MANLYEVGLHLIEGIGGVMARRLLARFGSAEEIFKAKASQILKVEGIGKKLAEQITQQRTQILQKAEKEIQNAEKLQIDLIFFTDSRYPVRLKQTEDAPILLYQKGSASLNEDRHIAIVGTRSATQYGRTFIEKFITEIKPYNPLIISGMAYGIDITAHREALKNKLCTIGVMANGLDSVYPAIHQSTAMQMIENEGALLSETPLYTKLDPRRFPARNRIIAALADIVLVVESRKKGGALVTAQYANDYNREVGAVPGNIWQETSQGCHWLIRKNLAHLVTSASDVAEIMNWDISKQREQKIVAHTLENLQVSEKEKAVLQILTERTQITIDELSLQLAISLNELAVVLLDLEMKDLITALPGKRFMLKNPKL
ncbi:MAG: DNA-processing protein DprA [Raineya sp.]|nr:DNA-processing protein DprA [Raineya sp.]MDW8296277.1 DNA-processing protein DprA [Raineya sp.]